MSSGRASCLLTVLPHRRGPRKVLPWCAGRALGGRGRGSAAWALPGRLRAEAVLLHASLVVSIRACQGLQGCVPRPRVDVFSLSQLPMGWELTALPASSPAPRGAGGLWTPPPCLQRAQLVRWG